jgi:excisionase family DNA binding protein
MAEAPRSMEIGSHLQRMSCYCALMAERLGEDADLIRIASRLHDVGMAAVSNAVTGKPGPLTPSERRELEAHPALGHAMLTGSGVELLETAAEIALTHHERYDGAGYPRGLAGDEILLAGRIVAVADAFDALTTDRVYRSAGSVEQAVQTLTAERGRHFDPRVVDAFLEVVDEAAEIRSRYMPAPDEQPSIMPEDRQITLQAAAATLAISPSRLRRWADEGRIPSVRTAGGHRRFSLAAVRRLAAESGVRPTVRPVEPPATPLPILAENLRAHGRQLAAAAAAAIYREGPPGWFASDVAVDHLLDWITDLGASCETGVYAGALQATTSLMTRAQGHAASLLERHAFLERFGQVCVRTLVRTGAEREEIAGTRRLFAALQQALLEARD